MLNRPLLSVAVDEMTIGELKSMIFVLRAEITDRARKLNAIAVDARDRRLAEKLSQTATKLSLAEGDIAHPATWDDEIMRRINNRCWYRIAGTDFRCIDKKGHAGAHGV